MSLNHVFMNNTYPQDVEVNDLKIDGTVSGAGLSTGTYTPTVSLSAGGFISTEDFRYSIQNKLMTISGRIQLNCPTSGNHALITASLPSSYTYTGFAWVNGVGDDPSRVAILDRCIILDSSADVGTKDLLLPFGRSNSTVFATPTIINIQFHGTVELA